MVEFLDSGSLKFCPPPVIILILSPPPSKWLHSNFCPPHPVAIHNDCFLTRNKYTIKKHAPYGGRIMWKAHLFLRNKTRHGYEAASASASASWSRSIWGQSFGFGFSFVVSKTQSFGFGFSFVIWEKLWLQLRLCNLTNPKFYDRFCCLKTWKTQHF